MNASPNIQPRTDFYVYALFREDGRVFYIGKGHGNRWAGHKWCMGGNRHKIAIIQKMQAAGIDVPKVKLHEGLTEATAFAYEAALIAAIGRADKGLGPLVNLTDGGEGTVGRVVSEKQKAMQSGKMRGRKATEETREKMRSRGRPSETFVRCWVGKKHAPESIEKMCNREFTQEHRANLRAPKSAEHRAKIAAALRARKLSAEHRAKLSMARKNLSPEARANVSTAAKLRCQRQAEARLAA